MNYVTLKRDTEEKAKQYHVGIHTTLKYNILCSAVGGIHYYTWYEVIDLRNAFHFLFNAGMTFFDILFLSLHILIRNINTCVK